MLSAADVSIQEVLRYFTGRNIEAALLVPTTTGMGKGIMDATGTIRDFLRRNDIHDFDQQLQGEGHKKLIPTQVVTCSGIYRTQTSAYRPITKHGDPRLWIYGLKHYAEPGNVLALVALGRGELMVINASNSGLVPGVAPAKGAHIQVRDTACIDLNALLASLFAKSNAPAEELLGLLRGIAGRWHPGMPGMKRDLEVGRLLEELLGIQANSSRSPDYKGIEIKASRGRASSKQTLFAKVPDWASSPLKSSAAILDAFGYSRSAKYQKQLRCTVSAKSANSQGLLLVVEEKSSRLLEASNREDIPKVAYWPMDDLQKSLLSKHPETFWVTAATTKKDDHEEFRYEHVLHTKKPMATAFPTLLDAGIITVDHLITRNLEGRVSEQGPLFRIHRKDFGLLFPPGELYAL